MIQYYYTKKEWGVVMEKEKGALILMDGIVAFIVGTLIGVAIHLSLIHI